MIAILASLGFSQRLSERLAPWVLAALFLLLAAACLAIWDYFDDRAAISRDRLEGNVEQLEGQIAADTAAADQRLRDAATHRQQERAYADAIINPAPGDHADPDVRLACEQLRRDGQNTTGIPACGGR